MAQAQKAGQTSRQPKPKKGPFAHTQNAKHGMGDYYGTGIKQKLGRVREGGLGPIPLSPSKIKKPPKSLA